MRKASITVLATLLALGATREAGAQHQGSQHGGMMGHGVMMGMDPDRMGWVTMMGMGGHVEGRLAFLKTELKITPAQEPLWNTLAQVMRVDAQRMAGMMPCCSGTRGGGAMHQGGMTAQGAAPSLPERLDRYEKLLSARLDALRTMQGALTPLYAAFSDGQRQVADQLIGGPMGMAMMM